MTSSAAFSPEEWTAVLEGPTSAGMIVVTAARGGTIRESIAMSKAYVEARAQHGESELLDDIVAAKPKTDHTRYHSAEEVRENGLKHLRDAVALLESKATTEEVDEYRRFVLALAEQGRGSAQGGRAEREPRRDRGDPADHRGARNYQFLSAGQHAGHELADPTAMSGEVCVVTGATSGIGKATAAALAGRGAQVVLVSRDRGRGEAAVAELAAAAGPAPRLEVADLASMGQVRALADRLGALERIDVLINNAGLMAGQHRVTADGFDEVFAVNHLAPFLLTNLLLGKLTAAGPARVITVTSDAHTAARLDLDDLQLERGWQSWRAYANSKLANILFTRELARRLEGSAVTANCAHPGLVRTRFGREARLPMRAAVTLARPFMLSPQRGARTIVYLATSPQVAGATGGYYVKSQRREPSPSARDAAAARRLWQLSEELTGLAPARPAGT